MKNKSAGFCENEITLFHYCIPESINNIDIQLLISSFSFAEQKYFNSIQDKVAQKRSLFGRIILRYVTTMFEIDKPEFMSITNSGKPVFTSPIGFDFNISHSGNLVVCCVTKDAPVGIDLEFIRPVDIEIYRDYFDLSEWKIITNSEHPDFEFLKLWVRKEAVIKADGRGMLIEMSSFNCLKGTAVLDAIPWYIYELQISPEYMCAVACNHRKNISLVNLNTVLEFENVIAAEQN